MNSTHGAAKFFIALLSTLMLLSPVSISAQQNQTGTQQQGPRPSNTSQKESSTQTSAQPAQSKEEPDLSGEDVVRVETDLTNILLTVIDRDHRFLTTLRQEDFRILENGVAQDISIFQRETDLPLTIAILIDTSKSQERSLPDEKSAAVAFVQSVIRPDRDRAAVVSFTGEATIEQPLTNDTESLKSAINRVEVVLPPEKGTALAEDEPEIPPEKDPRGWTGIWDAGWATMTDLLSKTPENTRRAIILLTDGDDTSSKTKKKDLIELANRSNVVVYSIGVEDKEYSSDRGALRKVSDGTGGRAFFPLNKAELQTAFAQIQQELRSQYLIAYSPKNKTRDDTLRQVRIEVLNPELRKQKLKLLYRQGYYYKQPQKKIG
ncbi:MAG: VWA domain-containing protein [Pyrinomonadaceae bacterium]